MSFLRSINPSRGKPDELLLEAYRQTGDLQALADLYERYMDLVYGLCIKYLNEPEAAKDAVMGIFEVLVRDLRKPVQVLYFKSWLYSVSKNYCLTQIRAAGKEKRVEISPDLMQSGEQPHLKEDEARFQRLDQCIEALPTDQRTVVILFYRENKCYNEIETITGQEWNRVRSHIQNARRNLKICMEKKAHVQKGV